MLRSSYNLHVSQSCATYKTPSTPHAVDVDTSPITIESARFWHQLHVIRLGMAARPNPRPSHPTATWTTHATHTIHSARQLSIHPDALKTPIKDVYCVSTTESPTEPLNPLHIDIRGTDTTGQLHSIGPQRHTQAATSKKPLPIRSPVRYAPPSLCRRSR